MERQFCDQYYLSVSTMNMISSLREQLRSELGSLGFNQPVPTPFAASNTWGRLSCALTMTLYPNVAKKEQFLQSKSKASYRKRQVCHMLPLHSQALGRRRKVGKGVVVVVGGIYER